MTAHTEEIAKLVGTLKFNVESAGLQRFQTMLRTASQQMQRLGADYTKLAQSMTKGLRIKVDVSQAEKAKAKLQQAMDKELKAETALQNAKRSTFQSQISQQKLVYTNDKERANLVTALVKDQQQHAVQLAKTANAAQQVNGITRQQVASQGQLLALQAKQAKLQQVYAKTQAITQKRDANHLLTQSKAQQIQAVTGRIVQQQQQQAIKHQAQMASLAAAASAKQQSTNNAQTKFQWQSQRHAVWQANQAAKAAKVANASNSGFSGIFGNGISGIGVGIAQALGPVGLALAGVSAAITFAANKMQERIEERQKGVVEAQGFNNTFSSISKNPEIAKSFRDAFINTQNENGGTVDTDTAKDFRTMAINMAAAGKTKDQIISTWDTRQKAFAVAGTTREDNKELNKQLGQMAADGTGAASDANIINDRMPMLTPYIIREYMKDKGITDYTKGLGAYNKDLKGGKGVKFSWYDEGMKKLVAENAESLERNRVSVASNLQRGTNQKFLQENGINSDPEIATALNERAQANKKLTDSMLPLNQAFERLDKNLTNLDTGAINLNAKIMNLLSGKNSDGTEDAKDTPRFKLGMKHRYKDEEPDYLKTFSKWLGFDNQDSKPETLEGFNPKKVIQLDGFQQMAQLYKQYESPSFSPMAAATTNNTVGGTQINAPITVEGATINLEVHGNVPDETIAKMMEAVEAGQDKTMAAVILKMPEVASKVLTDAFGAARAQQAERQ
jgi:hypothetical protein